MSRSVMFNGLDGSTGDYLVPQATVEDISAIARGESVEQDLIDELRRRNAAGRPGLGLREGLDPKNLEEAGWGILFAQAESEKIEPVLHAMAPLIELRKSQAGPLFKEFSGDGAYAEGESWKRFLARHGAAHARPVEPEEVPYYLLLVGSPDSIPFRFQYLLGVARAVGRVHFDTVDEYARYAGSIVSAERGQMQRRKEVVFFGPRNPDDEPTGSSADYLVGPIAAALAENDSEWVTQTIPPLESTKARLTALLHGPETPSLLFTASHGVGFPKAHERRRSDQGALVCQDWPGPADWEGRPIRDYYFCGEDLNREANLGGLIAFHFACYGAGTSIMKRYGGPERREGRNQEKPFVAQLPQRMLAHEAGGALAVVSHVGRLFGSSFLDRELGPQIGVFRDCFTRLMRGHPVGWSMEPMSMRHAQLSADLTDELYEIKRGKSPDHEELAGMWTANNDARSYVILGDPAARARPSELGGQTTREGMSK